MSDRIIVLKIQNRGMPGTGISEIEKAQITGDIAALLARPEVGKLVDLGDVDLDDLGDGMLLAWDEDDGVWRPTSNMPTLEMQPNSDSLRFGPVTLINARFGLTVQPHPTLSGVALLQPVYGTTANTVAEGSHAHTNPAPVIVPFGGRGYMSGGTQSLVTANVTLAAGISYVVTAKLRIKMRGADAGAANYRLTATIAGNARTSPAGGGDNGMSCVQGVPDWVEWIHTRTIVGTGATIPVAGSISWDSGAGMNVGFGEMVVELSPAR